MNTKILISALALSLAAPMAFADEPPRDEAQQAEQQGQASGQITWEQLDADGDGNISREEAARSEGLSRVFDVADANSDGSLTIEEYRAYAEAQASAAQPEPQAEPQPEAEEDQENS